MAEWLGNELLVSSTVRIDPDGVLFTTWDGSIDRPWFFDTNTGTLLDAADTIGAVEPPIPGRETAHRFWEDITRWGDLFVYGGSSGTFAFDASRSVAAPVLLEPISGTRVDYRYPVVLDNGQMFVTALESESGALGAEGPVYRLDLDHVLSGC